MWLLSGCAKLPCTLYFMGAVQATKTDQFSCLKSPLLQWKAQSSSAQSLVKLFPFLWMGGFWQLNISWGRKLNVKAQLSLPHVHPFPPLTPHPLLTPFLSGCTLYSMKLLWLSPLCPNSKGPNCVLIYETVELYRHFLCQPLFLVCCWPWFSAGF